MSIRELDPAAAWNEAEHRAIPLGFAGFFLGVLVSEFSGGLVIRDPFLAGVCWAVGAFVACLALLVGFYHRHVMFAVVAAVLVWALPMTGTALLLPWIGSGRAAVVPSVAIGAALYGVLHRLNRKRSGLAFEEYYDQVVDDQQQTLGRGWQRTVAWVLAGLGTLVIVRFLSRT